MAVEYFDIFDDHGSLIGQMPRDEVHRCGAWHRAAHVLVFRSSGSILIQQRAETKDLYAGLLDSSVGEHLRPGETFKQGAQRGFAEELGVVDWPLEDLGYVMRLEFIDAELGIRDREVVSHFKAIYDGPINPDPIEVAAVHEWDLATLQCEVDRDEAQFTTWFLQTVRHLGIVS